VTCKAEDDPVPLSPFPCLAWWHTVPVDIQVDDSMFMFPGPDPDILQTNPPNTSCQAWNLLQIFQKRNHCRRRGQRRPCFCSELDLKVLTTLGKSPSDSSATRHWRCQHTCTSMYLSLSHSCCFYVWCKYLAASWPFLASWL
jgi:hypothetical protein